MCKMRASNTRQSDNKNKPYIEELEIEYMEWGEKRERDEPLSVCGHQVCF